MQYFFSTYCNTFDTLLIVNNIDTWQCAVADVSNKRNLSRMSTIYPNSAKVLNRDPDFMGVPFQYHSIFSFGSSVGVRRASKRALSPSRRCSRLERGITNAGGGRVLPLPGFVWWKNGDSCGSYRYECPWSKLNKEQASSTNFFKSTVPLLFFFLFFLKQRKT